MPNSQATSSRPATTRRSPPRSTRRPRPPRAARSACTGKLDDRDPAVHRPDPRYRQQRRAERLRADREGRAGLHDEDHHVRRAAQRRGASPDSPVACPWRSPSRGSPTTTTRTSPSRRERRSPTTSRSPATTRSLSGGRTCPASLRAPRRTTTALTRTGTSASGTLPAPTSTRLTRARTGTGSVGEGEVVASPIAMASVAATVDTGTFKQPILTAKAKQATAEPLPAATDAGLKQMMREVVTQGTGRRARLRLNRLRQDGHRRHPGPGAAQQLAGRLLPDQGRRGCLPGRQRRLRRPVRLPGSRVVPERLLILPQSAGARRRKGSAARARARPRKTLWAAPKARGLTPSAPASPHR